MSENHESSRTRIAILACGKSINDLTEEQQRFLGSCDSVFGLNKYAAFHKLAGVAPTHIWFTDTHTPADRVLRYIIDVVDEDQLNPITLIAQRPATSGSDRLLGRIARSLGRKNSCYMRSKTLYRWVSFGERVPLIDLLLRGTKCFLIPPQMNLEYVETAGWPDSGVESWAEEPGQPLYQFLTSFTSLLNYIYLKFPNSDLYLAGADFNSPGYFFQDDETYRQQSWDDWTSKPQRDAGKHMALINDEDRGTLFDRIDFLQSKMNQKGIRTYSLNPHSALVESGFAVPLSKLPQSTDAEVPNGCCS